MRIGRVPIAHPFTVAALEEHSNYPFRLLMKQFGASLVVSERVDAVQVARRDRRGLRLLHTTPAERPRAAQLSGCDAGILAAAAAVVEELGFDMVDLNFECPIGRLLARGEGGALLDRPAAIARLVAAVVAAVSIPVTLKIRSGPDAEHPTAVEVAQRAEQAGAAAVSIHAAQRGAGLRRRAGLGGGCRGKGGGRNPGNRQRRHSHGCRRRQLPAPRAAPTPSPSAAAAWAIPGFFARPGRCSAAVCRSAGRRRPSVGGRCCG